LVREEEQGELIEIRRRPEHDLPREVDILYLDRTRHYQTQSRRATRQAGESQRKQRLSLPLVMGAEEARHIARRHLFAQWQERQRFRFTLPLTQAALEPGDRLTLSDSSGMQTVRLTRLLQDEGKLRVEAVAEEQALYESAPAEDERSSVSEPVTRPPKTSWTLLDLPALPGASPQQAGWHLVAAGLNPGWRGAVLYRRQDGGKVQRIADIAQAAVMGQVTSPPGDFAANVMDRGNHLEVAVLAPGALSSVTETALLNGANAALVGEEILQFQHVEALGAGQFRLSGLLRGRLGTEHATAMHSIGEPFVLLDDALRILPVSPARVSVVV
jgi:hypothetical protein